MNELDAASLRKACDAEQFDFESTEDIAEGLRVLGQERLTSALDFGVGIDRQGYNIFAIGPNETDKRGHLLEYLEDASSEQETPDDLCYINNFDDRYEPTAMRLPRGRGNELKEWMEKLIEDLPPTLTAAFETEEYENRRQALQDQVQERQDQTFEELQEEAKGKGLALLRTPAGFTFAPIKEDGDLMNEEEVRNLSQERRKELEEKTKNLQEKLQELIRQMPAAQRELRRKKKELDKEIATFAIKDLFDAIREDFSELDRVQDFLDNVELDIVENVQAIMSNNGQSQGGNQMAQMMGGRARQQLQAAGSSNPVLDRYRVNVVVDNAETEGAPVVYEDNPNYKNLVGRVEYKSKMGALTTNFNLIKSGALHRANGGYLVLDARQVLLEPFAWEGLKRALKSDKLKIESLGESYSMISTVSLSPEPVELDVKVVLLGQRMLYYLLCEHDPEFQKLFKVEADFEDEIDRNGDNQQRYSRLVAGIIEECGLRPFDRGAVARVIEQGSRMTGDNEKLSTQTEELQDLLIEADHWAEENGNGHVCYEDVEKAIEHKIYRSARLRDKVQETIERDTIFIDTEGEAVGQVNGLSVLRLGNLMFGRPNRITARVQLGKGEIINIEREVDLSGPLHSKGVLILKGYLGERYARESPLAMSASLVFEQSYSNIDGDSASAAELYALLSAIGDTPLKQSLSVTGSVNQHGRIQPIGGVNEKIEGFFDICERRDFTGEQGVVIPKANEKNLMLRSDVVEAVEEGRFHVWSIETIDEGMELLTGMEAGQKQEDGSFPDGTVNHKISSKLAEFAERRKEFATPENGRK